MIDHGAATLDDIRRAGVEALVRELGPVGMTRFLQQFETGRGDYTAERQRRQDQEAPGTPETATSLGEAILRAQEAGRLGPVDPNTQVRRP